MPRPNLINVDVKIGGRKCKVRKRGCSSSSSSSLVHNNRLKRAFLVGKRVGSSTPVPKWKMMSSKSPSMENDKVALKYLVSNSGEKARELSVSARKLAATLWEIDGFPSPRLREKLDDRKSEVGVFRKERILEESKLRSTALVMSDLFRSPVHERVDPSKMASHIRRGSAGSQKLLQADFSLGGTKSPHNCFAEVDQAQNHARSPSRHVIGTKNRLKDVYNGLITSKELLKVMSRVFHFDEENSTSRSLFSALKFELDRACNHVSKLIQEQRKGSEIDMLLKQLQEERLVWKLKEQDRIRSAIASVTGELEAERKLRRQTERLNKKLGRELAETRSSLTKMTKELESEKRAREIFEQVCDELARGIGEDRAEVEELKMRSAKVCEEVEKEREMLQLADVLREERVQMKLAEAKYQFEEKNALIDKLRSELEAYLKSKRGEEQGDGSPNYDKIKELEKYLRETLPIPYEYQDKGRDDVVAAANKNDQEEDDDDDDDDDDSDDNDLHSIELNMDDICKSFQWSEAVKTEKKKSKGRKSISDKMKPAILSEAKVSDGIEYDFAANKQETLDMFDRRGLFEFSSQPWKKDAEDELERYNMIKDLRDHIVSTSRIASSQDLASPSQKFGQTNASSKDPPNGVTCQG